LLLLMLQYVFGIAAWLRAPRVAGSPWAEWMVHATAAAVQTDVAAGVAYYVLLDWIFLLIGAVAFAGMKRGWIAAAALVVGSPVVGPGAALALCAVARERAQGRASLRPPEKTN
jgi:hypothetical protein